jgi:hypothetical protein
MLSPTSIFSREPLQWLIRELIVDQVVVNIVTTKEPRLMAGGIQKNV